MNLITKDLSTLVFMLLPGFMAAGIFYALTSHPKASEFERVIQALIFTSILKVATFFLRAVLLLLGREVPIGTWSTDVELIWSILLSVPLGLIFAWLAHTDKFYDFARRKGLSSRTSFPSEWYAAFTRQKRWVTLHLQDGRRLYGWPEAWPDQPDRGHFILDQPQWLLDSGERAPLYNVQRFLLPAAEVKLVEFVKEDNEVDQDPAEVKRVEQLLIQMQAKPKETTDGSEGSAASPEPLPERREPTP
jgi:hypothetical protein